MGFSSLEEVMEYDFWFMEQYAHELNARKINHEFIKGERK